MGFNLNITFSGMCLLTRDPEDDKLYVLLPSTHDAQGDDHHVARLFYDAGHSAAGGVPQKMPGPMVDLENRALDLSSLVPNTPPNLVMPPELFDIGKFVGERVSRTALQAGASGMVARVTLGAGRVTGRNPGGVWKIGNRSPEPMAISVTWTIPNVQGDRLELLLEPLSGSAPSERLELFPFGSGGNGTIHFYVYHTPPVELPDTLPPVASGGHQPIPGQQARHFRHFYQLFDPAPSPQDVPVYVGGEQEPPVDKSAASVAGSLKTCMSATAELEPE